MPYMHIENLYKNKDILLFKECYAMEKIHGTSAHIEWKNNKVHFYAGGVEHLSFIALFNEENLSNYFNMLGYANVIIYGEAYGGKCQGMSYMYGKELKFVVFEVKINDVWLNVPNAESVAHKLQLDFVPYLRVPTDIDKLNELRDAASMQSKKIGISGEHKREGIVLRPLIEFVMSNGKRVIAKHKNDNFRETQTSRRVHNDLEVLIKADDIANEWVTPMRLQHILQNFSSIGIENTGKVINAMLEDVIREGSDEIVMSNAAKKAISKRTAIMFKDLLRNNIEEE